eukprot:scaffold1237_cov243-Pinguiococcus_pyrenoidosus.AAC.29
MSSSWGEGKVECIRSGAAFRFKIGRTGCGIRSTAAEGSYNAGLKLALFELVRAEARRHYFGLTLETI